MKALIPVAGEGTRLRPHTYTIPKALLNVAGKPILGHIIDTLIEAGIEEFCFITGYMGDRIRQWAEEKYDIPMAWVIQKETLGLGHAILMAEKEIAGAPVFIILGDTIFDADLQSVLDKGGNTLGVMEVEDPSRFGVVVVEGEKVVRLVEKPDQPISFLAIAGLYLVSDTDLLIESLKKMVEDDIRTRGEYQLTDALSIMIEKGAVFRTFNLEAWYDCGIIATTLATNRALLEKTGGSTTDVDGDSVIIPPVHIDEGVMLEGSIVGPHVSIENEAVIQRSIIRNSIIGRGARVEGANLDGSLLGNWTVVKGYPTALNIGDSSTVDLD